MKDLDDDLAQAPDAFAEAWTEAQSDPAWSDDYGGPTAVSGRTAVTVTEGNRIVVDGRAHAAGDTFETDVLCAAQWARAGFVTTKS